MARVDNLDHFLTDVADAIRTKKGTQATIQASDFDTEIENIPSGGDISEYMNTTFNFNPNSGSPFAANIVKKIENVIIGSNVTSLYFAFGGAHTLTSINFDATSYNIKNISNFSRMFTGDSNLTNVDLSNIDGSSITSCLNMFDGCSNLQFIDLRSFTFGSNITNFNNMLNSVPTTCKIIVGTQNDKTWFNTNFSSYTNVKTVAEYEAEQNA